MEEYKRQIKSLTVKLKEVSLTCPCEWLRGWTGLTILSLLIRKPISLERRFQNRFLRNPMVLYEDWDYILILPADVLNQPGRLLRCSSLPIELCAVRANKGDPSNMYKEAADRKWRDDTYVIKIISKIEHYLWQFVNMKISFMCFCGWLFCFQP